MTGQAYSSSEEHLEKNPYAVALGRLGGMKGGPARAAKLSKAKLSEIGRKAAAARWEKNDEPPTKGSGYVKR